MSSSHPDIAEIELRGILSELRPVRVSDYEFLYLLAFQETDAFRWCFPSTLPNFEGFKQHAFHGVHAVFTVESRQHTQPVGLVVAHNANFQNGTAIVTATISAPFRRAGIANEACRIFLKYLFSNWTFRKVYFHVPEYLQSTLNVRETNGALECEGRLQEYLYSEGKMWDELIFATYRSTWVRSRS